jgi:hypothetical protein
LASGLAKIEVEGYSRWPWIFFGMFLINSARGVRC